MSSNFIFKPPCWLDHTRLSEPGGCLEKHEDQLGRLVRCAHLFIPSTSLSSRALSRHLSPEAQGGLWPPPAMADPCGSWCPPTRTGGGTSALPLGSRLCGPGSPQADAPSPPCPVTLKSVTRSPNKAWNPMASLVTPMKHSKKNECQTCSNSP